MVASSFAKTYLSLLKSHPLTTNVASGLVLMTTGDGVAQVMEGSSLSNGNGAKVATTANDGAQQSQLQTYTATTIACPSPQSHALSTSTAADTAAANATVCLEAVRDRLLSSWNGTLAGHITTRKNWNQFIASSQNNTSLLDLSNVSWDPVRTVAAWCFFYAPFYLTVYRLYDKYLPKQTPGGIVARVALSFATSLPVNAAFYCYGTAAHHTHDWWQEQQRQRQSNKDDGDDNTVDAMALFSSPSAPSFDLDDLWNKISAKLHAELPTTMQRSACCWVPVNLITFAIVPSHLQPLTLMVGSVFWNCYLSLSQHRDVPPPVQ